MEHGHKTEAIITLERHVRGRIAMRQTHRYGLERIPTKREDEGGSDLNLSLKRER